MMSFSRRLQHLLQYSTDSQLFPNLQHYLSITWPVDRWLRHHNVFTVEYEQWHQFMLQEWPQHNSASFHRLKYKDATFLKEPLRGLFIHGRDHALTHGHVFCQRFVWDTYKATLVTPMSMCYCPCSHLKLKYFFVVQHLDRFCAATNGVSTYVPLAYLSRMSFSNKRRISRPLDLSFHMFASCMPSSCNSHCLRPPSS